jgi:hypothetical protein
MHKVNSIIANTPIRWQLTLSAKIYHTFHHDSVGIQQGEEVSRTSIILISYCYYCY